LLCKRITDEVGLSIGQSLPHLGSVATNLHTKADTQLVSKSLTEQIVRTQMPSAIVVVGLRASQCKGNQFTIALNIFQVEIIVSGNGIGYLAPGRNDGFLSLLTTGGKKQQSSEKMDIYAVSAQFISILGAKVIIFLQISLKMCNFAN
jgi:hypothetical protein